MGMGQQDGMTIGELARRSGVPVKTIRYYSDIGLLPESGRTAGGYRHYDDEAAGRLAYIRTLRELGLGLSTVRAVLARPADLAGVAEAHAEALEGQIRILRMHRSVLRALARRPPSAREVQRMTDIARASATERQRIMDDFLDHVFGGLTINPDFERMMRSARPELPDEPTAEQLDAWIELADLLADQDFRARIRGMAEAHAADKKMVEGRGNPDLSRKLAEVTSEKAGAARKAGIDPAGPEADAVVDEIVAAYAGAEDVADDAAFRKKLLDNVRTGTDRRAERYWQLLAVINGWPPVPSGVPDWEWFLAALEARQR